MDLTGFLVVANLTGCASAVAARAANDCLRSIAPPLQTEAKASVWETGRGTENIADLQITTLKSKRLLPSRFKVGKLTFSTHFFFAAPLPPFASAPDAPGCRGGALPRSFPGFSRVRETGPPEAYPRQR